MAIMVMGRAEIEQYKEDIDIKELKTLLEDILKQIAVVDLDYLYELRGYVENLIDNFKEFGLEEND
jgi:hypothetical protein